MLKFSGIYCITNIINNKCYIGSSCNISVRFRLHKSSLKRNKHHSIKLQNAWNKYGESSFKIEILVKCPLEYLKKAEQKCILVFKPEYNITNIVNYVPDKPIFRGKQNDEWVEKRKNSFLKTLKPKTDKTKTRNAEIVNKLQNGYSYEKISQEYSISICTISSIKTKNNVIREKNLRVGEKNNFTKLKKEDIVEIRTLRKEGTPIRKLSVLFNVTEKNIQSIVYNKTWKHIVI